MDHLENKKYTEIIQQLEGHIIQKCLKLFITSTEEIPDELKDEETDGIIYLILSTDDVYEFYPITEKFSLGVKHISLNSIPKDAVDISSNNFWSRRIGKEILKLEFEYKDLIHPHSLNFSLLDAPNFQFRYLPESKYDFDTLIITE